MSSPHNMKDLALKVLDTQVIDGISLAQSLEHICQVYHIDDGKKEDLRHTVQELKDDGTSI